MGILIPRFRHINEDESHPIEIKMGLRGEYRAITRDLMGNIKQDTGWKPNLLTNLGIYNWMNGTNGWATSYAHVGSSSQAVSPTDTSLVAWLAADNSTATLTNERNDGAAAYSFGSTYRFRWTHAQSWTVREFGISVNNTNINMNVRSLVTPDIIKASDQTLDIYHRLTGYPDLTIQTGQVTIYGTLYDYELRPCEMDQSNNLHNMTGRDNEAYWYEGGTFGSITGRPTGTSRSLGLPSEFNLSKTNNQTGTESRDERTLWPVDYGDGYVLDYLFNRMGWTSRSSQTGCGYQVNFSKNVGGGGIQKANTQIFWLDWRTTFSRYP